VTPEVPVLVPRRLVAAAVVGGCVAATALSAVAAPLPVTVDVAPGTRTFEVTRPDGSPLDGFDFRTSPDGVPFRVTVSDSGVTTGAGPFSVTARMSNLYLKEDGQLQYAHVVPSNAVSLGFTGAPTLGDLAVGVVPTVDVTGALSCSTVDWAALDLQGVVQTAQNQLNPLGGLLGPVTDPLTQVTGSLLQQVRLVDPLVGTLLDTCSAVAGLAGATVASTTQLDQLVVDEALVQSLLGTVDLRRLPVSVAGGAGTARFQVPARIPSSDDPATGVGATTLPVMSGRSQSGLDSLTDSLAVLDSAVRSLLQAPSGVVGDVPLEDVLAAVAAQNGPVGAVGGQLATAVTQATGTAKEAAGLDAVADIVSGLTATLQGLTESAVTTVNGVYAAHPVLKATPTAARPGTYEGVLLVDFVQQ
jgi:hypothetical protein